MHVIVSEIPNIALNYETVVFSAIIILLQIHKNEGMLWFPIPW